MEPDAGNSDSDGLQNEGDSERLREARVGDHSERVRSCTHTFDEFTGKVVNSGTSKRECHAGRVREYSHQVVEKTQQLFVYQVKKHTPFC